MTDQEKWLISEAQKQAAAATDFATKTFYQALAQFCREQAHAAELMRGEIDGRTWNHEQW
ncbi:hypothetical protein [Lacticaseibacillus sharpeae]|uniref:Uncharacterized protein n=1 Tax=Lacticaseibacillus sharpeae JCM 1186 = DSM 20505 TaxID=1291052 RepID=A0A0R1ZKV4_9LACO|nr:hypothetical protein [Lacticaseibacillus sharpeae]KRM54978.1 hypothetical protein FC18_GL001684 [Lacticaseibacillus sharpeae JCM 1186 = DSM 20505]